MDQVQLKTAYTKFHSNLANHGVIPKMLDYSGFVSNFEMHCVFEKPLLPDNEISLFNNQIQRI